MLHPPTSREQYTKVPPFTHRYQFYSPHPISFLTAASTGQFQACCHPAIPGGIPLSILDWMPLDNSPATTTRRNIGSNHSVKLTLQPSDPTGHTIVKSQAAPPSSPGRIPPPIPGGIRPWIPSQIPLANPAAAYPQYLSLAVTWTNQILGLQPGFSFHPQIIL